MGNAKSLEFFENMAENNPDEKSIKINKMNDFSKMDANFVMKYANSESELLDLASGTGILINKIYDKVKHITAVEIFEQFTKFIKKTSKIEILNQNIALFETARTFDLITMFGIVSYFNKDEIIEIYSKNLTKLKENGKLIIKNQFGVQEDVLVSGYSEELKKEYYSQYRHLDTEVQILKQVGYKNVEVFDIYPPECNRWDNTHFWAIVAGR